MPLERVGELAALGTSVAFTITALAFESAGRRVGSLPVNILRLVFALAALTAIESLRGTPYPVAAPRAAWMWLSLSGLVGFAFGDLCLFRAFVVLGSRLATLVMALVPPLTALFSYAALGEVLTPRDLLGMALTLGGIAWVVFERRDVGTGESGRHGLHAILLGVGGALGQAGGLVLSKKGLAYCDPFPAAQIRMTVGLAAFVLIFSLSGRWGQLSSALRDRAAMKRLLVGAVFGPLIGGSLALFAVRGTEAGVAATLMALTPVLVLPAVILRRRERVTLRAAAGAALAVAGTAVLLI